MSTIPEYIAQWRNKQIESTALMRLLVSHPAWSLPVSESAALEMMAENAASRIQYNRDPQGVNRQLIFSSPEAFAVYQKNCGEPREQYLFTTTGAWVFRLPLEGIDEIWIDPLTPGDIRYVKAQFNQLRAMADAIEAEQSLAALRQGTAPDSALSLVKNYAAFWVPVLVRGEGMHLMFAPDSKGRKLAAVFTSEDTLAAFLPEAKTHAGEAQVVERIWKGKDLFPLLLAMPIDGIVFNCAGPVNPVAFAKGFALLVSEAPAFHF